jgi:hypothetical protein
MSYKRPPGVVPFGTRPVKLELPVPNQLVQPQSLQSQGGLDIRLQINNFLEQYGQMVLVQRMNLNIHCPWCWNEENGEGDPQCPYCLGRGFLSVLERHVSRKMSSLNEHRQQIMVQSAPGPEIVDEVFWYFEYDTNPQEEDMIYEVSWSDPGLTLPFKILTSYRINYSFPYRGNGGEIEYWRTACTGRPINNELIGQYLRRITPQILQVPEDGLIRYVASHRS